MVKRTPIEPIWRQSLFDNTLFSDCTIKSGDREWPAHKAIICRNTYFKAAFDKKSGFKEAETGEISMDADDPEMIECLLKHLYGFVYENSGWEYLVNTYILADKYDCASLKRAASTGLKNTLLSIPEDSCMPIDDFCTLVLQVYNGIPDADREIRNLLSHFIYVCNDQLTDPAHKDAVMQLFRDCPEFPYDFTIMQTQNYDEVSMDCDYCRAPFHGQDGPRSVGVVQSWDRPRGNATLCSGCFLESREFAKEIGFEH